MAKKTFLLEGSIVRSLRGWYIDYNITHMPTGNTKRQRKQFNLNDIEALEIREAVAVRLLEALPDMILDSADFQKTTPDGKAKRSERVVEVLDIALAEMLYGKRKDSKKNPKTAAKYLREWLDERAYAQLPADQFTRRHAKAFKSHLRSLGRLSGRTINNYISDLVTIWNYLPECGIEVENPFSRMKKERQAVKKRRTYTAQEKTMVVKEIEKHYWLYRALLLLYYCGIRRNEMCRLRFGDFDLKSGVIHISEEQAKTHRKRMPTIPTVILPLFRDETFNKFPKNHYVFGRAWLPNPNYPLNPNRISKAHRVVLDKLVKEGKLDDDIGGLDFYAWKDTAISRHLHITTPIATRDQVGHASLDQTMEYYHQPLINREYRELPDTLHDSTDIG